ncbi:MAG TPA: family 43 glycosylhydrolase [Ruminiclostridium sp.]|nr:family 43 glycosylhydrolase [Ruminiclostridium sp.]
MIKKFSVLFPIFLIMLLLSTTVAFADIGIINNGTNFGGVQAHGGSIIKVGDTYYWYGENRDSNNLFVSVRVYSSTDLVNWTDKGNALSKTSAAELNSCNIERPKVMYNASTGQYVMWMHYENGRDYTLARAAVAYSSSPTGPFTYIGSFRPNNNMSRDCTTFVDTDGTGYFISAANENADLAVYRLTSDYKSVAAQVATLWPGQSREAPCMFKKGDTYYMITSGCTGWSANQQKYATSASVASGWTGLSNLGNSTCYDSQGACVFPVGSNFVLLTDRWAGAWGGKVSDSSYLMMPLLINGNSLSLNYTDTVKVAAEFGAIANDYHKYTFEGVLTNADPYQWNVSQPASTDIKVLSVDGDKALQMSDTSTSGYCYAYKDFPAKKGTVTFNISFKYESTGKWDRIRLYSGNSIGIDIINFEEGLGWLTGTSSKNIIQKISANTWYQLKIVADTSTQTFDVYINNTLVKTGCTFTGQISQFDRIALDTGNSFANTAVYDDIIIK